MKEEEMLEQEKAKFMASRLGQDAIRTSASYPRKKGDIIPVDSYLLRNWVNSTALLQTPLSLISDEDAIQVAKIMFPELKAWAITISNNTYREIESADGTTVLIDLEDCFISWDFGEDASNNPNPLGAYQYLLQNKYAIDFYSSTLKRVIKVEEQVELGWVKLKTEN